MTILFAYDGSESADAAIAAAGQLLGDVDATADVVTVWEPLTVEALRAARFGGSPPIPPDVADVDRRAAAQAKRLASAVQDSRIFPARIRRSTERGITPSEGGTCAEGDLVIEDSSARGTLASRMSEKNRWKDLHSP